MASARLTWPSTMFGPGRRVGVLEVGHEPARARVQRVDHHLAVGGAGDLDPAVGERAGHRRHRELLGRGHEVERAAAVELGLAVHARGEQLAATRVELAVKTLQQREGPVREHLLRALDLWPAHLHHRGAMERASSSSGW